MYVETPAPPEQNGFLNRFLIISVPKPVKYEATANDSKLQIADSLLSHGIFRYGIQLNPNQTLAEK